MRSLRSPPRRLVVLASSCWLSGFHPSHIVQPLTPPLPAPLAYRVRWRKGNQSTVLHPRQGVCGKGAHPALSPKLTANPSEGGASTTSDKNLSPAARKRPKGALSLEVPSVTEAVSPRFVVVRNHAIAETTTWCLSPATEGQSSFARASWMCTDPCRLFRLQTD